MADYYTPTVVQPTIPYADMTPLEQLLLMQIFESESNDNGLYFFAEIMPTDQLELPSAARSQRRMVLQARQPPL